MNDNGTKGNLFCAGTMAIVIKSLFSGDLDTTIKLVQLGIAVVVGVFAAINYYWSIKSKKAQIKDLEEDEEDI